MFSPNNFRANQMLKHVIMALLFSIISKHAEDIFHSCIQIMDKMLNRTGPRIEPWHITLLTGCQPDAALFIMNL